MEAELDLEVMGTRATLWARGPQAETAVADGALRLWELERRWSRFDAGSEVSRLNRAEGQPVTVSADTTLLLEVAQLAHAATHGACDATVLGAVLRNGYLADAPAASAMRCGVEAILIDDDLPTVTLPADVGIDPGGIGKGLAADLVIDDFVAAGIVDAYVEVGGDARVIGAPRGFATPSGVVVVRDGAIATSGLQRAWTDADGTRRHHLLDPRTGDCVATGVASVTVIAARGWQADALTKAVMVLGVEAGLAVVEELGAAACARTTTGRQLGSTGWAQFSRRSVRAR